MKSVYSNDSEKVLTVSIAAYNAEDCVGYAIQSCLIDDFASIEIIVVNDGSTDGTAAVVQHYLDLYPDSIRLINKENGGYGSTINASLNIARGKYFKLLDSDDSYDTNAFAALIKDLAVQNVDIAITPFTELRGNESCIIDQASSECAGVVQFDSGVLATTLRMHSVAFRTNLLRDIDLRMPEHRFYTDVLFVTRPLPNVHRTFISHRSVYQYNLGMEGQSVSAASMMRNWRDLRALTVDLIDEYEGTQDGLAKTIICRWIAANTGGLLSVLYGQKPTVEFRHEIDGVVDMVKRHPRLWDACRKYNKTFMVLARHPRLSYRPLHCVTTLRQHIKK